MLTKTTTKIHHITITVGMVFKHWSKAALLYAHKTSTKISLPSWTWMIDLKESHKKLEAKICMFISPKGTMISKRNHTVDCLCFVAITLDSYINRTNFILEGLCNCEENSAVFSKTTTCNYISASSVFFSE